MSRTSRWGRMSRKLLATVALAGLVVGGLAPATRAAVITFSPNGTGNTGAVSGETGFTYNTGDVLITNAITPGTPPVNNPTGLTAFYQSVLTTVNGNNTLNAGANFGFGGSNNYQYTVVAGFSEQFASAPVLGPAPSGSGFPSQVTTTLQLGGGSTNFFEIFANSTNANPPSTFANFAAGTGFGAQAGSVLVLAGTIQSNNFVSQFNELGNVVGGNFVPGTATFDPNAPGNGDTKYQNMSSVIGNGSTNLSVAANVAISFASPAFFPNPTALPLFLNFQTTSSLPFGVQVPSALFYSATTPTTGVTFGANIGPGGASQTGTNGVTGPDFMFQANSSNSFAVPEPGSITMALTAMGLVSLAGGLQAARRRRNKTSAV